MRNLKVFVSFVAMLLCANHSIMKVVGREKRMTAEETLLVPLKNTREANCECGKLTRTLSDERLAKVKIPGGRVPWLAELVTSFDNHDNEPGDFRLCYGTLISLQTLVFPASCIDTNARKRPQVRLLGIDSRKESIREVASFLIHPHYRRKNDNDIALVKLKQPIDFNQTKVVPICLQKQNKKYSVKYPTEETTKSLSSSMLVWNDNTGFANSDEDNDARQARPCRNPQPPCQRRPCPPCPSTTTRPPSRAPTTAKPKPPAYQLKTYVPRTWFYRKGVGYDYNQFFGRFDVDMVNNSVCSHLFPEMLRSKVTCVQQKEIRDIAKQNGKFFSQLELGMPLMLTNTSLVKNKPQPATTKYYLNGMRAPGSSGGIPLLGARQSVIPLLKFEDYVPWIRENSHNGHFCKS